MTITSNLHDFFVAKLPRVATGARRLYGSFSRRRKSSLERLPNELLSYILSTTVDVHPYEHGSILKLTHVCSRWRHVALSTRKLWANILVASPNSSQQLSRIATWLSRSGNYPLDLLLDFRDPSWNWEEDNHRFSWQDMEFILRVLLVHVKRWRHLQLLTDTWAPIFTFLWYTRRVESAPELETVALSRCNAYFACKGETFKPTALRQPIALFGDTLLGKLTKVSLVGVHVDWLNTPFQNLSELELKFHARDVMPSLQQFTRILLSSPTLCRLTIMGWGPYLTIGSNSINHTQEDIVNQYRSIVLPLLESLTLGFLDTEYAIDLLSLFFLPSLKSLTLEDITATVSPEDTLNATPFFEWLSSSTFPCFHRVNIWTLRLNNIHCSETTLIHFFRHFTGLKILHVSHADEEALKALAPCSIVPKTHDMPCSELMEMHCQHMNADILVEVLVMRENSTSVLPLEKVTFEHQGRSTQISDAELRRQLTNCGVKQITISLQASQNF